MKIEEKGIYKVLCEKGKTKDGREFTSYKIIDNETQRKVDLRFTKAVKNLPEKRCYIVVKKENINLDNRYEFPRYWVKQIEEIQDIVYNA